MNARFLSGLGIGLTVAVGLIVGIVVADAATDQGDSEVRLPGAIGPAVEVIPGRFVADPEASPEPLDPLETPSGGFVPLEEAPAPGASTGGRSADLGSTTTTAAGDGDPFSPPVELPEYFDFSVGDLLFEWLDHPSLRFEDVCADGSGAPACPDGVGGTVLAPFDGGLGSALGDFRLGEQLGSPGTGGYIAVGFVCDETTSATEYPVFVWASHPATFEISYHPQFHTDRTRTVTVTNSDSDHPEFERFAAAATEGRLSTTPWPRECFLLDQELAAVSHYVVQVEATSFTGDTASKTYTYRIPDGQRPGIWFDPLNDHDIRVHVPIRFPDQGAHITAIRQTEDTSCADVETTGSFGEVLPAGAPGTLIDWGRTALDSEMVEARRTGRLDATYDGEQVVNLVGLQEGTTYLICTWWLEGGERSFDDSVIVDRQQDWVTTPNRNTVRIVGRRLVNDTGGTIAAGAYTVEMFCHGGDVMVVPSRDLSDGETEDLGGIPVLCDLDGTRLRIPISGAATHTSGDRREFALGLNPSAPRGFETFEVDLDVEGRSGPVVVFNAYHLVGSEEGGDRWQIGTGGTFEPNPTESEELPDEIRIDHFSSGVSPEDRESIRVTAAFDRAVTLDASLLGDDLCVIDSIPAYTTVLPSETHSFTLDGLCLRTFYSVMLTVTDALGNRATFADVTVPPFVDGATYWAGTGRTDGYRAGYSLWVASPSRSDHLRVFAVEVDGTRFDLRLPGSCVAPNLPGPGFTRLAGFDTWGEEVEVTIFYEAVDGIRGDRGACEPTGTGNRTWRASITSTFTIAEFRAGDIAIPFVAAETRGRDGGFDVTLIISGTVTE